MAAAAATTAEEVSKQLELTILELSCPVSIGKIVLCSRSRPPPIAPKPTALEFSTPPFRRLEVADDTSGPIIPFTGHEIAFALVLLLLLKDTDEIDDAVEEEEEEDKDDDDNDDVDDNDEEFTEGVTIDGSFLKMPL